MAETKNYAEIELPGTPGDYQAQPIPPRHVPGPLTVEDMSCNGWTDIYIYGGAGGGELVARIAGSAWSESLTREQSLSYARQFAATPDLLAAAKAMAKELDDSVGLDDAGFHWGLLRDALIDAIIKAEGRTA